MKYLLLVLLLVVVLLSLPNQALAGCSYSTYPHPITGQPVTCITCCSINALGERVCNTNCG